MYRNAVVTTDGSEVSFAALRHVKQVVDPNGTVTVVEVIDDPGHVMARTTPAGFEFGGSAAFAPHIVDEVIAAQQQAAEVHLQQAREYLEQSGLRNVEAVVLQGIPGDAIVEYVDERDADIVIMSTHGRSGLKRTILGSVADHVLRHLDETPVLLIRPDGDDD